MSSSPQTGAETRGHTQEARERGRLGSPVEVTGWTVVTGKLGVRNSELEEVRCEKLLHKSYIKESYICEKGVTDIACALIIARLAETIEQIYN